MNEFKESAVRPGIWPGGELDKRISSFTINSKSLIKNCWGDTALRTNYIYSPQLSESKSLPVVLYLPGFLSSAQKSF